MQYYKILKLSSLIKNHRLKFLGLFLLHIMHKRYLAVNFDPVLACNLRCRMCYFTDDNYVKTLKGYFPPKDIDRFAKSILSRALKLQIGCGAEPTLYKEIDKIITIGKEYAVPYISLTTNANLIEKNTLNKWVYSGLNEITVSLHGVKKETYEYFMQNGNFNRFKKSLQYIKEVKKDFPDFKLRVNYTFNEDNFKELEFFFKEFGEYNIDILQIRPITKIGNSDYSNFSMENILPNYDRIYNLLKSETNKHNITFIAPSFEQLSSEVKSIDSIVSEFTYCYISPKHFCKDDFDWKNETYNEYSKRIKLDHEILKCVFYSKKKIDKMKNKTLNYLIS